MNIALLKHTGQLLSLTDLEIEKETSLIRCPLFSETKGIGSHGFTVISWLEYGSHIIEKSFSLLKMILLHNGSKETSLLRQL